MAFYFRAIEMKSTLLVRQAGELTMQGCSVQSTADVDANILEITGCNFKSYFINQGALCSFKINDCSIANQFKTNGGGRLINYNTTDIIVKVNINDQFTSPCLLFDNQKNKYYLSISNSNYDVLGICKITEGIEELKNNIIDGIFDEQTKRFYFNIIDYEASYQVMLGNYCQNCINYTFIGGYVQLNGVDSHSLMVIDTTINGQFEYGTCNRLTIGQIGDNQQRSFIGGNCIGTGSNYLVLRNVDINGNFIGGDSQVYTGNKPIEEYHYITNVTIDGDVNLYGTKINETKLLIANFQSSGNVTINDYNFCIIHSELSKLQNFKDKWEELIYLVNVDSNVKSIFGEFQANNVNGFIAKNVQYDSFFLSTNKNYDQYEFYLMDAIIGDNKQSIDFKDVNQLYIIDTDSEAQILNANGEDYYIINNTVFKKMNLQFPRLLIQNSQTDDLQIKSHFVTIQNASIKNVQLLENKENKNFIFEIFQSEIEGNFFAINVETFKVSNTNFHGYILIENRDIKSYLELTYTFFGDGDSIIDGDIYIFNPNIQYNKLLFSNYKVNGCLHTRNFKNVTIVYSQFAKQIQLYNAQQFIFQNNKIDSLFVENCGIDGSKTIEKYYLDFNPFAEQNKNQEQEENKKYEIVIITPTNSPFVDIKNNHYSITNNEIAKQLHLISSYQLDELFIPNNKITGDCKLELIIDLLTVYRLESDDFIVDGVKKYLYYCYNNIKGDVIFHNTENYLQQANIKNNIIQGNVQCNNVELLVIQTNDISGDVTLKTTLDFNIVYWDIDDCKASNFKIIDTYCKYDQKSFVSITGCDLKSFYNDKQFDSIYFNGVVFEKQKSSQENQQKQFNSFRTINNTDFIIIDFCDLQSLKIEKNDVLKDLSLNSSVKNIKEIEFDSVPYLKKLPLVVQNQVEKLCINSCALQIDAFQKTIWQKLTELTIKNNFKRYVYDNKTYYKHMIYENYELLLNSDFGYNFIYSEEKKDNFTYSIYFNEDIVYVTKQQKIKLLKMLGIVNIDWEINKKTPIRIYFNNSVKNIYIDKTFDFKKLIISDTCCQNIENQNGGNLQYLDVSYNKLSTLNFKKSLNKTKYFNIANNYLNCFVNGEEKNTIVDGVLQYCNIVNNDIQSQLIICNNNIEQLYIENNPNLTLIDANNNKIKQLISNNNDNNLTTVLLDNQYITKKVKEQIWDPELGHYIEKEVQKITKYTLQTFKIDNLKKISLYGNRGLKYFVSRNSMFESDYDFKYCVDLIHFDIQNSVLFYLDLTNSGKLEYLNVNNCNRISLFYNNSSLKQLYCSNIGIKQLMLQNSIVQQLDASNNNIEKISLPQNIINANLSNNNIYSMQLEHKNAQKIDLTNNNIHVIGINQNFNIENLYFDYIENLYLSNYDIEQIQQRIDFNKINNLKLLKCGNIFRFENNNLHSLQFENCYMEQINLINCKINNFKTFNHHVNKQLLINIVNSKLQRLIINDVNVKDISLIANCINYINSANVSSLKNFILKSNDNDFNVNKFLRELYPKLNAQGGNIILNSTKVSPYYKVESNIIQTFKEKNWNIIVENI